jgi:hypothetical protein
MVLVLLACAPASDVKEDECAAAVDLFGADGCRALTTVGTAADGLVTPRDLAFSPDTGLLWVVDAATSGVAVFHDPGTDAQWSETRVDHYAGHFMDTVSSLAFGVDDTFATCQESRDDWNDGDQAEDDFMGPTLWDADLDVFAEVGQTDEWWVQEGSHLDMLHQSPLCMGIAHEADNQYWTFDGLDGAVVFYDFRHDHGPGGSDHSDGLIAYYADPPLTRVEHVPGHMMRDPASSWLYIADTGAGRVVRLDTTTGTRGDWRGRQNTDGVEDFYKVTGATWEVFAEGLDEPAGLVVAGDRILVGERGTGDVVAFGADGVEQGRLATDAAGLDGLEIGPEGKLWYVDEAVPAVVRVDP